MEIKQELNVREFFEGYHVTPQDVYSKKVTVVGLAAQASLLKGLGRSRKGAFSSLCTGEVVFHYSPSTMYQEYSINEELFHWQSQSRTTEESTTGQRYINQSVNGGNVLFFVREYKK